MTTRDPIENLVIGGGLAGSMVAMRLASAGREVLLIEKEREPHDKVCGEFLSAEAVQYLRQARIEPLVLGAHAIQCVRLHSNSGTIEARLPFTALSLSRRILDEALLMKAQEAGCAILRGAYAERLEPGDGGWSVRLRDSQNIRAKEVFLATGKHDLSGWKRGGATQPDLVGFKMHWRLAPAQYAALDGFMDLFLFQGGYGGFSIVEDQTANLCLVIRRKALRLLDGWNEVLESIQNELPALQTRLAGATPLWPKPLAISPIPYGHLGGVADGLWRVGDQAAVIPSFTGDGMSIALHTGVMAARMYLDGETPERYLRSVTAQLRTGMRFASALSRAMVSPFAQSMAPVVLSMIPGAMARIARSTRIPDAAILRAQFSRPTNHAAPIAHR